MDAVKRIGPAQAAAVFVLLGMISLVAWLPTLASGVLIGSAFKHEDNVLKCGTPSSAITWTTRSRAIQRFQHCSLVATYATVTPIAPKPTITAIPTATFAPTATSTPWPTAIPTATQPASTDPRHLLLGLINQHRASVGLGPLALIADATTDMHAVDMAATGFAWHVNGSYPNASFPYDGFVAENVGAGDPVQVDALMWGEAHDAYTCATTINHACNMIDPRFHSVAIGIASGFPYGTYEVQDFR